MIWIKRFSLLMFLLLLLVVALFAYITLTNGGMQRIFSLGQSYLVDELTIGGVDGKLVGPGSINDIAFNSAGTSVNVDSVDYDWNPRQLFSRKLSVETLQVKGVTVRLPETKPAAGEESAEPFQLKDLKIPFILEAKDLSVEDINIYPPGADEPVVIDKILLRADGEEDAIQLLDFQVDAPLGNLQVDGTLNTSGDWPLSLDTDWAFNHEQFGQFTGSGSMIGDLKTLRVQHEIKGLVDVTIDADVFDVTGMMSWDGNVKASSDDLGEFSEGLAGIPFELDADTKGSLEKFEAQGKLSSEHAETGPFTTDFNLSGDLEQIEFEDSTVVFEQTPAKLTYSGTVDLTSLEADLTIDWEDLAYPLITEPKTVLSPEGSLRFTGSAEKYKVQMNSKVQQELAGDLNIVLMASGTPDKLTVNTLSVDGPPTSVYAVGVIDLKTREVDVKGNWKDVRWPLIGDEELVRSSKADFSVKGTLDDYQLDAELSLAGKDIPEGDWTISTRGNTEELKDLTLKGDVLEGQIDAKGSVVFSPQPSWDLAVNATDINPGVQWPEHPGKVTFSTITKGSITDSGPDFIADIQDLSGNYRGKELGGGGRVAFADGKMSASGMKAKVGGATIDLDGALGDDLDLKWKLDAEQISDLVPGMEGNIQLEGTLGGTREEPELQFDLAAEDFRSGSMQGKKVTGSGVLDLSGKTDSNINIEGESLRLANYRWRELKILGDGKPEQHRLSVSMTGDAPDITLELNGGVEDERWNGSINQLMVLQTPVGDWTLHEPVAMEATKESFSSKILCMTNLPAVVCTDGTWQTENGVEARIALESFNSELFSDLMPPDIAIDAPLSGNIDASVKPGGKPNAVAHFDIPSGRIQFESKGDVITAILGESEADVVLTDDKVTSTASLALGEIGTIDADVVVSDLYGAQNLSGEVATEVQDISLAGIGASQVRSIDGAFLSSLKLGGTLQAPQLEGDVSLENFGAEVPSLSLKLRDGNIKAVSDGKGNLVIDGQIKSGDGELTVGGFFNSESGGMDIDLAGENFQIANAKKQKAVISTDLNLKVEGETVSVLGELIIPTAFIETGGESGAIVESPDTIVIERPSEREEEEDANGQVILGVNVVLGDDVRVKVGQFDGALGGELDIEQVPGQPPTGSGTIEVLSGDFFIYGQKLTMERGNILFGGGPLDNPGLEIDVARDVPIYEVKAGAKVRGTAQAPTFELESDPPQTDANTISYILFGKPVGAGVGFTLGKFITPDLFVSYGIDLFDQIRTFNARYKLNSRLTALAASSNTGTDSADLLYTFER